VERGDHDGPLDGHRAPVVRLESDPGAEHPPRRDDSEGRDDRGPDDRELRVEVRRARRDLLRVRRPIARGPPCRRTTEGGVRDPDGRPLDASLPQQGVQDTPGGPLEWQSSPVLVLAGCLAQEEQRGAGVAAPVDDLGPRPAKRAAGAADGLGAGVLQILRKVRRYGCQGPALPVRVAQNRSR
jgi:hypothetical protein